MAAGSESPKACEFEPVEALSASKIWALAEAQLTEVSDLVVLTQQYDPALGLF